MPTIITVLVVVIVAAAVGALCFYLGITYRKRMAEAKLGSAEEEAKKEKIKVKLCFLSTSRSTYLRMKAHLCW